MTDFEKTIALLKTSNPADIFKKVVAFNEEVTNHHQRAAVCIGLNSGYIQKGTPVKMDSEGNAIFTSSNDSISYVNAKSIVSIEILNPQSIMELLTDGSYFEVPKDSIPTNLNLKRAFKAIVDVLENTYGFNVVDDVLNGLSTAAEKYQFEKFPNILQEVLEEIATDNLGKQALNDLKEMNLAQGENQLEVEKKKNTLVVSINFKKKFTNDFKDKLKVAFESNL